MAARETIDEKLDAFEGELADTEGPGRIAVMRQALGDRHYRLIARAASLADERFLYELAPDLIAAFRRLLENAAKRDPGCYAKNAVARALVNLECDDAEFYSEGVRYVQREPVWGGSADTAVDVRVSCAMGLVMTGYSRALVELTELLHDPEPAARIGAVRAVSSGNPREAELLLRAKVFSGDEDPAVVGECFTGLLAVEPDESLPFVAGFLDATDEAVRELAALALGESRLDGALGYLSAAWETVYSPRGFRRALVRAVAALRSDAGLDWLASVLERSDARAIEEIVDALAIHRSNATLATRLEETLQARGDRGLLDTFARLWKLA